MIAGNFSQEDSQINGYQLITDFEIVRKLGTQHHRKFNGVHLVKHRKSGILGVYKQLIKNPQNKHLQPLLREEAGVTFREKGLPKTLAFLENEEEIVLIRNYQEGIPLDQYWKTIPGKKRKDFIVALIEKLVPLFDVLEKEGIVHCDLKPSNIIVSNINNELEISLIDFGMAIRQGDQQERKTLFALGYSAPELILNKLNLVDRTSDIFSLGIIIWQLFTGNLPLTHANPGIMTNLQITHPLPEHKAIPKQFRPVLAKMCFKHTFRIPPNKMKDSDVEIDLKTAMGKRYQNLEEILAEIKNPPIQASGIKHLINKITKRK